MMTNDLIARAGEIIAQKAAEHSGLRCVLALIDKNGYPTASTITVSKADSIRCLTFCTGLGSDKTERIKQCNRAGVCFSTDDYNITLVGTIEIVTDQQIKKDMWYDGLNNHFTGPDDPGYCVLRFTTERYNLLVDWKEAAGTL